MAASSVGGVAICRHFCRHLYQGARKEKTYERQKQEYANKIPKIIGTSGNDRASPAKLHPGNINLTIESNIPPRAISALIRGDMATAELVIPIYTDVPPALR